MASSDEEGEIVPDCVDNYSFIDDQSGPVSLSILPLLWSTSEIKYDLETKVFLSGTSGDGLQKIFKQIIAWKFELSYEQPEISVLSKDKNWITLLRPKKNFQSSIRSVLVTVHWLYFVRRNPEESRISVWKYILKVFSSFDVKPSEYDVQNHVSLIRGAAERDKGLAKSEYLLTFIKFPQLNEVFHEDFHAIKKSKYKVDSEENANDSDGVESSAVEEHCIGSYDTVCAICDNGGEILPCVGKCLRSFHATTDAGVDTFCESLGYSTAEVNAMPNFLCANCKHKQNQCFACGKLGSSDESSIAEVFLCIIPNCGRYYHPECIAKLLSFGVDIEKEEITKRVSAGKSFVCPLHVCSLCRKGEDKNVHDFQFAMCRRCPKAYHRKCLPRILSMIEESTSAFEEEELKKSHQVLSTNSCFSETALDKNLTQGKVEGSVKAIQAALQKLQEGSCLEDAKAICEPGILNQIFIWQRQLKVYLAPFLHGMRYTSFGRHFTKIDKLKEVVDRLQWYVQNGDMIVDFACGSNDFSCLMKSKVEQIGKSCSFKNYDIFQAKNDFNFEKRDWMSVNVEELPNGSQLIIGLNPPFGVKGSLANKFINKALTFKPKLLVLIVPKVTKRLDRKKGGYNLIWEDDEVLSGKSFYLPGSVDTRDKQMEDWNQKTPPLYLWSRPDWTARHTEIAQRQGHIKEQYAMQVKGYHVKNYLMEENHDCYMYYSGLHAPDDISTILDGIPQDNSNVIPEGCSSIPAMMRETLFPHYGRDKAEETQRDMDLSTP